jgi:hypothetical protein
VSTTDVTSAPGPVPPPFARLVDDAALFPPGDAPMARALSEHHDHRRESWAELLDAFVVGDRRLPELGQALEQTPHPGPDPDPDPMPRRVVVSGRAGALEPAVTWARRVPATTLRGVEIALRDEEDLAHNARRVLTALDQLLAAGTLTEETETYVEMPRLASPGDPGHGWLQALDELAAADVRVKLRTGGVSADAFPSAAELATCIGAILDRELSFKCTAGLHHALRHRARDTEFEHHGFLNVLLATRASLDGATGDEVAAAREERDRDTVLQRWAEHGDDTMTRTRRWFTGFGSCSVLDPLHDLVDLGLVARTTADAREAR